MPHSERLAVSLRALDDALADKFPLHHANLRAGARANEIERFETFFGRPLPDDVRQVYEWHDGEVDLDLGGSLPDLQPWVHLAALPEECLGWEEAWQIGFQPDWIPFELPLTRFVRVFDATGSPSDPTPVIDWSAEDRAQGRLASVQDMIDEMIRLLVDNRCGVEDFRGVAVVDNDGQGLFPSDPFDTPFVTDRPFRTRPDR